MAPARRAAPLALFLLVAACGGSEAPPTPPPPGAPAAGPAGASRGRRPGPGGGSCADPGLGPEPDAGGLQAFVRRRSQQVRDCYQRELKRDSTSGGRATLQFTIGPCGQVSSVEVIARSGRVAGSVACLARAMRGWRTPFRPAQPVTVEHPFAFSPSM